MRSPSPQPSPGVPGEGARAGSRRRRFVVWHVIVLALLAGHVAWLWLLRGPRILDRDPVLITGQLLLGGFVVAMAGLLATTPAAAIRLPRRRSEAFILAGGALLQVAAIALLLPGLSEDVVRYRIDGRMWLAATSPYATTPGEWIDRPGSPADGVDRLVPHRQTHAIYPPVGQALFALTAAVESALLPPPPAEPEASSPTETASWRRHLAGLAWFHRGTTFRIVYALFAVGCALVLLGVLRDAGRSPWWAALFAWNPLVVIETGGMGHQEAAGALFVLLAVFAATRGRGAWAGAMLALAVGVKPHAAVMLPFVWRDAVNRSNARTGLATPFAFVLVAACLFAPALAFQDGFDGFRASFARLSTAWEANGSVYELFKWAFGEGDYGWAMERAKTAARRFAILATLGTAAALWLARAPATVAGYWLMLVILLVSPVAYPWYLIWPLCLVPLMRGEHGWTVLVWSATAVASYVVWHEPTWVVPRAYALLEYVPVYGVLGAELALTARRFRSHRTGGILV